MAVADKEKGQRATAGIIFGWLYDKKTNQKHGGLVCEYNGSDSEEDAKHQLHQSLNELYSNGYSEDFNLKNIELISDSFIPEKKYGTCLISLCFTNYYVPFIQ